jgi:hypothetical protein
VTGARFFRLCVFEHCQRLPATWANHSITHQRYALYNRGIRCDDDQASQERRERGNEKGRDMGRPESPAKRDERTIFSAIMLHSLIVDLKNRRLCKYSSGS